MTVKAAVVDSSSTKDCPRDKVVFAITSDGNDFYSCMTRLSVASLRLNNPHLAVMLVSDRDSAVAMQAACDPLLGEVDECLAVDTPPGVAVFRNRFVKTSLRTLIDGPFLFLDSDILVRGDLKGVFELDCDFAAACNHSCRDLQEQIWHEDRATLEAMSCTVDGSVYFNGGVLYFNDTAGARRFSLEWHRLWLKSSASQSHCRDQPALNAALHIAKPRLAVLADDYNAQLRVSPAAANGAKIWHYYSFKNGLPHTLFELYVQKLLSGGELRIEDVAAMIKQHHPWRRTTAMDDLAAARIMQRNRFDGWEGAWLRRALGQHLKCLGGNVWTRARQMVF